MTSPTISETLRDRYVTSWALLMQSHIEALAALDDHDQVDSLRITLEQILWKYCATLEHVADESQRIALEAMNRRLVTSILITGESK